MKRLFLSAIFSISAVISNAQVINLKVSEYQETVIKNNVTTINNSTSFNASYIFDITNNMITSIVNGNVISEDVFTFHEIFDDGNEYIGLAYNKFPNCSWLINLTTKQVVYIESRSDLQRICSFTVNSFR